MAQNVDPFEMALQDLQGILVDLNGDGRPDAVVRQPQGQRRPGFELIPTPTADPPAPGNQIAGNAMMRVAQGGPVMTDQNLGSTVPPMPMQKGAPTNAMAAARGQAFGPPNPAVQIPMGDGSETRTTYPPGANERVPEPGPFNAMANFGRRALNDVARDPVGATGSLVNFMLPGVGLQGGAGAQVVTDKALRGAGRRAMREFTHKGREANARESRVYSNVVRSEDIAVSRQPPHKVQVRDPKTGRLGKIPDEIRAARERGIQARRVDQQWRDAEGKLWKRDANGEVYPTQEWVDKIEGR